MQTYKKDLLLTIEQNIEKLLDEDDNVVYKFQVALLDHPVIDLETPMLFVSNKKLIISFDETIEVYQLEALNLGFAGEYPVFTFAQLLLEKQYHYNELYKEELGQMRSSEPLLKIAFFEEGQVPKDFLIRDNITIRKGYQNWAIGTILINHQKGIDNDPLLFKMRESLFYSFNSKTVLTFALITFVYFLIRLLLVPNAPELVGIIFDVFYGIFLVFMGIWLALTMKKNLERYRSVFRSYVFDQDNGGNSL